MATSPSFIGTPHISVAALSSANTALDGSGVITPLAQGAASGTRILEIDVQGAASTAAGLVNIFLSLDSGVTWTLFDQVLVTLATASNTVKAFRLATPYNNLVLKDATHRLGCTTTIAQPFKVTALGGDL